ncbi:hypothetical protein GGS26DRAFT_563809 [Hypomontagnella submonticulosa]|nr:hypothetical protein GGS26DRAFT_563809 [Hypomontagnella submonticulosa]
MQSYDLGHPAGFDASSSRRSPRGTGLSSDTIWDYPGLEQDTFYASASYIHRTQRTLSAPLPESAPETPEVTRVFLDHLADCFAWTKHPKETASHVTATAILTGDYEQESTILIAKNILHPPHEEQFAEKFFSWLNGVQGNDSNFWNFLVLSNKSRLEHYITQVRDASADIPKQRRDRADWYLINNVIDQCGTYNFVFKDTKDAERELIQQAGECAMSALQARRDAMFRTLCNTRDARREQDRKEDILSARFPTIPYEDSPEDKLLEAIEYLGRLCSGYEYFIKFRNAASGAHFAHRVVTTEQARWDGDAYKKKIMAWANVVPDLEEDGNPVSASIDSAIKTYGYRGSVHCEMQLLCYFIEKDAPFPDYIGCSKKACALCQHVLTSCNIHANDQHGFIYPRWSLPDLDFKDRTHLIAAGLMSAHASMLSVIQESVRSKKSPKRDQGVMHTSARITRRVSFSRFDGFEDLNPEVDVYVVHGRSAVGSVPAVHFPQGEHAQPRIVRMHLYERIYENMFDISMRGGNLNGKMVLTAIEINDRFRDGEHRRKLSEFLKCYWMTEYDHTSKMVMMFKVSRDFEENKCLRGIMDKNEEQQQLQGTKLPRGWSPDKNYYLRGEVFILPFEWREWGTFVDKEINLTSVLGEMDWHVPRILGENPEYLRYPDIQWKEALAREKSLNDRTRRWSRMPKRVVEGLLSGTVHEDMARIYI